MNNKVYYKVLDKDMKSSYTGFQYELNKAYSTDEELSICESGFHACKEMYELVLWTANKPIKECRFFECILGNKVIKGDYKVVSNSITIVKEISFEEVDKSIRKNIDILTHNIDKNIRANIARQGYGLDILIHDESRAVKYIVAEQGYGLDILIKDKDPYVRVAVAEQGYGLDILIHDDNVNVRDIAKMYIKKKIKEHEKMKNDSRVYYKVLDKDMKSPLTDFQYELGKTYFTVEKLAIYKSGFHVCKEMYEMVMWLYYKNIKGCRFFECTLGDRLLEDDHVVVSNSIRLTKEISFEEVDKSIRENLETLVHDKDVNVRTSVAAQGYGLDILVHDIDPYVRAAVAGREYKLDILVYDENWIVRKAVASQGYGLDILIIDKDWAVRKAVADQGYGLDTLIGDTNSMVREAVAMQGYRLDILIHDKSPVVRAAVAEQGYGLELLINDKDEDVRVAVANQGYRLDILKRDRSPKVREAVAKQGYSLDTLIDDESWGVRIIARQMIEEENT